MKKHLLILAGAALLGACEQATDITVPPTTKNVLEIDSTPVSVLDQPGGRFQVDSRTPEGARFQNTTAEEATFEFIASGRWSFTPEAGLFSAAGLEAPATKEFIMPGGRSFALVARREDGTCVFIGEKGEVRVKPGTSLVFLMNDLLDGFGDNRGALTVEWSKKP
jgi:hypothetical protein